MRIRPVFKCTRCTRFRMSGHCGSCNSTTVPLCSECLMVLDGEQHRCTAH